MVGYIFCKCGKVVDEYESLCYWCKEPKPSDDCPDAQAAVKFIPKE